MHHRILTILGAVALSMLLAAGCSSGKDTKPEKAAPTPEGFALSKEVKSAGCTTESLEGQEAEHIDTKSHDDYNSDPPSSGAHWPLWPRWGVYDKQVQDEYAVHSLEHGGVVIWYGDVDDSVSATFPGLAKDEPKIVVSPRKDLDGIAAVAWQQILTCPKEAVDELSAGGIESLLSKWIEETGSTATDAEKDAPANAPPASEFEKLPEQPPTPVVDSTIDS